MNWSANTLHFISSSHAAVYPSPSPTDGQRMLTQKSENVLCQQLQTSPSYSALPGAMHQEDTYFHLQGSTLNRSTPHSLLYWNMRCHDHGLILEDCGTFGRWSLGRGSESLETGLEVLYPDFFFLLSIS